MATTSNHLRGASELMLVAPIKDGFVDHASRLISYATRLGHLLEVLLQGRRVASEANLLPGAGPLERLDTIFSTQWAIRQRPQRSELIVSAVFDSSWEAYMRNLQTNTGELLDAIFCHCEGYEQHTCVDHGYEAFSAWLRDHQVQTRFFHSAAPELTVSDLRGLRRFAMGDDTRGAIDSVEQAEARVRNRWPALGAAGQCERAIERERALKGMAALAESFSKDERFTDSRTERETYDAAIQALLASSLDADLQARARELRLLPNAAPPASKADGVRPIPEPDPADIQHNILSAANDSATWDTKIKHGCLVMLQCDDAPAAARLLASLIPRIATTQHPDRQQINVALTHAGLARLEPGEATLDLLPLEFREGMASRAGLLGDVGPHAHPHTWERLQVNWPEPSARTVSLSSVDVVLLVQRAVPQASWTENDHVFDRAHPLYEDLLQLARALELEKNGVHVLHVQALRRYRSDHFRLGEETHAASQPLPPWPPAKEPNPAKDSTASKHEVPLGEVLLGHRNRHGRVAECALAPDGKWLFDNGTFLVVRKLEQKVEAFERYIERSAGELAALPAEVKAWALGRHPVTGRTLVDPDAPDPKNEFDYSSPAASHCPLHAHVRRANPRLADTPRILRRSFPYGSEHDPKAPQRGERGLVFMAYNASIAEQFEVIQRWLNGGNITALPSFVNDLIAGVPQLAGVDRWLPGNGDRRLPSAEQPFVALRWGLYLFVPSMSALARLADLSGRVLGSAPRYRENAAARRVTRRKNRVNAVGSGAPARRAQRAAPPEPAPSGSAEPLSGSEDHGLEIIADIFDIEDLEHQRQAWKEVLEEPARVPDASAVWAAIRNPTLLARLADEFPRYAPALRDSPPHTLPTPYGLLVSSHAHAREIFGDDGRRFSVEEYEKRLDVTLGGHYLGLDGYKAQYSRLAPHANAYLASLPFDGVYGVAKAAASAVLAKASAATPQPGTVSLPGLAMTGIGAVAAKYLFTPESVGPSLALFVKPFIPISRHCFQPYPDGKLESEARRSRAALEPQEGGAKLLGPFAAHLRDKACGADAPYDDDRLVRSAMVGAMVGFAPPAVGHVATILSRWLENGELERHSRKSTRARMQAIIRAMTEVPVPPTVYRKIKPGARLEGRELLPLAHSFDTDFVVVGTQSVTLDARQRRLAAGVLDNPVEWQWLFAGDRSNTSATGTAEDATPAVHGCPARHAAVAAVLGIIDAVSEHPNARLCGPLEIIPDPFAQPA
jgi:hypothetical protein